LDHGSLQLQAMLLDGTPEDVAFGMLRRNRRYFYLCDLNPVSDNVGRVKLFLSTRRHALSGESAMPTNANQRADECQHHNRKRGIDCHPPLTNSPA